MGWRSNDPRGALLHAKNTGGLRTNFRAPLLHSYILKSHPNNYKLNKQDLSYLPVSFCSP